MKNKKLIRFVESLILLPMITMSGQVGVAPKPNLGITGASQIVLSQKENMGAKGLLAFNQAVDQKALMLQKQGEAIDAYFAARNMPLLGMGRKMAEEAINNDLDWRLLAAIAVRESTGGRDACNHVKNNSFGWGSCKIGFKTNEEAIETVARNLGGNNPNTAKHYDNKTTLQILRAYNPPSIVPKYGEQVISIMNAIGQEDMAITIKENAKENSLVNA